MSGAPRMKSLNCGGDSDPRPVLGPAGNKLSKPQRKVVEKPQEIDDSKAKKSPSLPVVNSQPSPPPAAAAAVRCFIVDQKTLKSNLSFDASCSSDASSSDSSQSRPSTGRMSRRSVTPIRRKQCGPKTAKVEKEKVVTDADSGSAAASPDSSPTKKRCAWVTPNSDPCYAAFHDEEWGVPVHDEKKLFELLIFSTALSELSWPAILSKRQTFREVFLDFDPISVSKLNEKKLATPGTTASTLLSELKLRAIIENARQMCKVIEEFGSFDKYIWGFVNHKPTVSQFRYPRQVPIKTSKADAISKDLVRRGFRGVGPTVVYSFMQVAGITNDHLITCFRFQECIAAADASDKDGSIPKGMVREKQPEHLTDLGLARGIDDLNLSTG